MLLPKTPYPSCSRFCLRRADFHELNNARFPSPLHAFAPLLSLLLSIFMHGSWLHLLGNMLFLWIYGDNVESQLGKLGYLFWYLLTGVAATVFHASVFHTSKLPLVGASGAISGVLGFYFVWFPHNRVRMLMAFFPFIMRVIELPARLVLGFYIVLDNLLPFVLSTGTLNRMFGPSGTPPWP